MATGARPDSLEATENDQEFVRTAAVSLGVWLTLTLAAVAILLLAGDGIMNLFL